METDRIGHYMMIPENKSEQFLDFKGKDLLKHVNETKRLIDPSNLYCIGELWDGLHFLLTGNRTDETIEDKLSEAIIGIFVFDVDSDDGFVSCNDYEELPDIIDALEAVDIASICKQADLSLFRQHEIYPDIWQDEKKDVLMDKLTTEYENLLAFYKRALRNQMPVIFSVFEKSF